MAEEDHPKDRHEYLFQHIELRLSKLEGIIHDMEKWRAANDEKTKTIFTILSELKEMLEAYTEKMEKTLGILAAQMEARFTLMDKDIREVSGQSGKKSEALVDKVLSFIIGGVVAYLVSLVLK